ncbi:FAD:protein FMN transferase [Clarias magur]|uniref:FAD:protein FMN transferase n=1 Tax=Clarias magur TaxID=1594786 RepID=A0A8J4X7V7_CLAMG|nr:FAD:protein FMN transferase [Clarias magur]
MKLLPSGVGNRGSRNQEVKACLQDMSVLPDWRMWLVWELESLNRALSPGQETHDSSSLSHQVVKL